MIDHEHLDSIFQELRAERMAQEEKHGTKSGVGRHLPLGTRGPTMGAIWDMKHAQLATDTAFAEGHGTWWHILMEEIWEADAEEDPAEARRELVQIGAVVCAIIEDIDRTIENYVRPHEYTYDGAGPVECTFTELNGLKCGLPEDGHGDGSWPR